MSQKKFITKATDFVLKIPMIKSIFKFTRYSMVGGLCALIDYVIFFIGFKIIGLNYLYALAASLLISGTTGFILHKHFTFRNKSNQYIKQISKYILVVITSIILNFTIMYVLVDIILVYPLIARIETIFLVWLLNFTMHNFFTFWRQ